MPLENRQKSLALYLSFPSSLLQTLPRGPESRSARPAGRVPCPRPVRLVLLPLDSSRSARRVRRVPGSGERLDASHTSGTLLRGPKRGGLCWRVPGVHRLLSE